MHLISQPTHNCLFCCMPMHILTAGKIMTILLIANSIVHFGFMLYHGRLIMLLVMTVINIPIYAALIFGIFYEKKIFLLPFNIAQMFGLLFSICLLAIFLIGIFFAGDTMRQLTNEIILHSLGYDDVKREKMLPMAEIGVIVGLTVGALIEIWLLRIGMSAYNFLRARETLELKRESTARMGSWIPDRQPDPPAAVVVVTLPA